MAIYFTADTHFGHTNIIKYCNRPFKSCEEMDEILYNNWSSTVQNSDEIYHLGDVIFGQNLNNAKKYISKISTLSGKKFLIPGNHDPKYIHLLQDAFTLVHEIHTINAQIHATRQFFVLCHYPMLTWQGIFRGVRQLFGHVHGLIAPNKKRCDVGVDVWSYTPVRLETLLAYMDSLPDMEIPDQRTSLTEKE